MAVLEEGKIFYIMIFFAANFSQYCNQINMTGATSGAGTAYPFGAPEFTPGFQRVRATRS